MLLSTLIFQLSAQLSIFNLMPNMAVTNSIEKQVMQKFTESSVNIDCFDINKKYLNSYMSSHNR